jgi:hypothetical protein
MVSVMPGKVPPQDESSGLVRRSWACRKLLDAAGTAMNRGDWQRGVNILKPVIRDYRQSQEAACARSVMDQLVQRGR